MSLPPDDPRRPTAGSGDDWDAPESWLSDALPAGTWTPTEPSDPVLLYQTGPAPAGPPPQPTAPQPQLVAPQPQPWQTGPAPPYYPTGPQPSWAPEPPQRRRTGLVVGLCVGAVVVVGLVVVAVLLLGRGSGPDPVASTTHQRTGPSPEPTDEVENLYEATRLTSVERSVLGQLAKGDCFDEIPDLEQALTTPTVVDTTSCADPHRFQVVGFVDITDISTSISESSQLVRYTDRCENLMAATDVPEGLRHYQGEPVYFYPSQEELDAGVGVVMCLVASDSTWTGSALDGTAKGY